MRSGLFSCLCLSMLKGKLWSTPRRGDAPGPSPHPHSSRTTCSLPGSHLLPAACRSSGPLRRCIFLNKEGSFSVQVPLPASHSGHFPLVAYIPCTLVLDHAVCSGLYEYYFCLHSHFIKWLVFPNF